MNKYIYIGFILIQICCHNAFAQEAETNERNNVDEPIGIYSLDTFWTIEQANRAVPYPIPELSEEEYLDIFGDEAFKEDDTDVIVDMSNPEEARNPTRANINISPYKSGGKLFFTLKGNNYSCSATFVSPTVLLTAAHCVRDADGTWATNVLFRRAYSNGGGQSVGNICFGTKGGWVTGGSNRYKWDYAFIKTSSNSAGGNIGLRTGIPYASWESTGYPGNYGSGQYMYKVTGRKGRVANGVVEMLDNPMTYGSSGGAWIGGSRYGISVNSHLYTNRPGRIYGPLFDGNVSNLYNYVNNNCR